MEKKQSRKAADNDKHEYGEKFLGVEGEIQMMVNGSLRLSEEMMKTLGASVGDELVISEEDNLIYLRKA